MMPIKPTSPMQPRVSARRESQNSSCEVAATETVPSACGAKTRSGSPCRDLPMRNGRCRMHGGGPTGPRTASGLARSQTSTYVHGGRSRAAQDFRRMVRDLRAEARRTIELA